MKLTDKAGVKGHAVITLYGANGLIKEIHEVDNLTVDAGKAWIAARIDDTPPAAMSHMAVGTGTTAPAAGNTALETELARVALDSTANVGQTTTYTATFAPGVGTGAITEAGIFNAAAAGTLLARLTFPVINKGAADTMTIVWDQDIN